MTKMMKHLGAFLVFRTKVKIKYNPLVAAASFFFGDGGREGAVLSYGYHQFKTFYDELMNSILV